MLSTTTSAAPAAKTVPSVAIPHPIAALRRRCGLHYCGQFRLRFRFRLRAQGRNDLHFIGYGNRRRRLLHHSSYKKRAYRRVERKRKEQRNA